MNEAEERNCAQLVAGLWSTFTAPGTKSYRNGEVAGRIYKSIAIEPGSSTISTVAWLVRYVSIARSGIRP